MATLVLTTVGTLVGGPLGGAIGAFTGRALDNEILGNSAREGPRLEELALSTSSYGTAIPRYFGAMRSAGSVIWSTELSESSQTSGGKGRPKTTTFSYSASFAVALSSRPIIGVGRIWANGTILRDTSGELTTDGAIRVYRGYGDQTPDELISASESGPAPAFRGLAYIVFENLQLAEFGNRIPALTFEIIADEGILSLQDIVSPVSSDIIAAVDLPALHGFADKGGPVLRTVDMLGTIFPVVANAGGKVLKIEPKRRFGEDAYPLPESVSATDSEDFGPLTGLSTIRAEVNAPAAKTLRYYDTARDYLPGIQRSGGQSATGSSEQIELPAALSADAAKNLIETFCQDEMGTRTGLRWRIAELNSNLQLGCIVSVPGQSGQWSIIASEWRETGVELELVRLAPLASHAIAGDSGAITRPSIRASSPTLLRVFELPWDGNGPASETKIFAAASGTENIWSGATLFANAAGQLDQIGNTSPTPAIGGILNRPLAPSEALLFEPDAIIEISLHNTQMGLASTTIDGLARGENTLLVGPELLQFAEAQQISERGWMLKGLLRGRGGTESAARIWHPAGTRTTLIDRNINALDTASFDPVLTQSIFAIGKGDQEPASAVIENIGLSLRPLIPVHGKMLLHGNGDATLSWIRRARGAWSWPDGVDSPINEEQELYCVGCGPVSAPAITWQTVQNSIDLTSESLAPFSGLQVWVQQIGSHAKSPALYLGPLT